MSELQCACAAGFYRKCGSLPGSCVVGLEDYPPDFCTACPDQGTVCGGGGMECTNGTYEEEASVRRWYHTQPVAVGGFMLTTDEVYGAYQCLVESHCPGGPAGVGNHHLSDLCREPCSRAIVRCVRG